MTAERQRANVRRAAVALAPVAREHELVISHGNGPQVGLLALQAEAGLDAAHFPLDVLGAQTEGMIGYMIEQELGNLLPFEVPFATLLTMVEVDPADPAFAKPDKPIGPVYAEEDARRLAKERGWSIARDGNAWRRVVASPLPKRIFEIRPVKWLLEKGTIVICGGGGGIPTVYGEDGKLQGVEAVIDKDRVASLLAQQLDADFFVMATDVPAVSVGWGTPSAKAIRRASPAAIGKLDFESGSMSPKVEAARGFAERTGKTAAIGALEDIPRILAGEAGTLISNGVATIEWASPETLTLFQE
jgi:carbamate kinase